MIIDPHWPQKGLLQDAGSIYGSIIDQKVAVDELRSMCHTIVAFKGTWLRSSALAEVSAKLDLERGYSTARANKSANWELNGLETKLLEQQTL